MSAKQISTPPIAPSRRCEYGNSLTAPFGALRAVTAPRICQEVRDTLAAMKQISGRAIVAVLAAPTSTVVQALAHGVKAPIGAVPWSEVGPGWLLAIWSPATPMGSGAEAPEGRANAL